MNIEQEISLAAQKAVKELYGQDVPEKMVQLQKTKREFEGSLTLVVFPFLKMSHKKPEDTAQEIGQWLGQNCRGRSNGAPENRTIGSPSCHTGCAHPWRCLLPEKRKGSGPLSM